MSSRIDESDVQWFCFALLDELIQRKHRFSTDVIALVAKTIDALENNSTRQQWETLFNQSYQLRSDQHARASDLARFFSIELEHCLLDWSIQSVHAARACCVVCSHWLCMPEPLHPFPRYLPREIALAIGWGPAMAAYEDWMAEAGLTPLEIYHVLALHHHRDRHRPRLIGLAQG